MTMTAAVDTRTGESHRPAGVLARIAAPFVSFRKAWVETEQLLAAHLLTLDDGALHTLGYRRSQLERGIVHSVRAD